MVSTTSWSWYVNRNRQVPVLEEIEPTAPPLDSYLEKLVKLFPVEIVAAFTGADQFARTPTGTLRFVLLVVVAVAGLVLLPGAFSRFRKIHWADPQGRLQYIVGVLAYLVWVYSQDGGLSAALGIYQPAIAGVLVVLFLAFVAVYSPQPTTE